MWICPTYQHRIPRHEHGISFPGRLSEEQEIEHSTGAPLAMTLPKLPDKSITDVLSRRKKLVIKGYRDGISNQFAASHCAEGGALGCW